MYSIRADTIAEAHQLAVKTVLEHGETVVTEDGKSTLELDEPLCVSIMTPYAAPQVCAANPFKGNMMDAYIEQFISEDKGGFIYTYGNRIQRYPVRGNETTNQLFWAVNRLKDNKSTRRSIVITWVPSVDVMSADPPCLQSVQFLRRNDYLHATAFFRSNDIALAYGANCCGLYRLMEEVQNRIDDATLMTGALNTISNCAHVYDTDFQVARKIAYGQR